jgi:D-arginine dehydrogenase
VAANRYDVIVIGGGIAGVGAAAFLSERASVVLLEQEAQLAHHTTGRSAALLFENYGHPSIRPLTRVSLPWFESPPDGLVDAPLLSGRGALTFGRPDQLGILERLHAAGRGAGTGVEWLDTTGVRSLWPEIRPGHAEAGVWEPGARDLDVAAIHQAFVRAMRRHGGEIHRSAPVHELRRANGRWQADTGAGRFEAAVVVDAAGAWGDRVARMAGVVPVGLRPLRRTAFTVPGSVELQRRPMAVDADHAFYIKPDGTQLLCSPADETPSEPCDARPEEADVALAIDRINAATTLGIVTVRSAWAGLRTFAPDGGMVVGFDDRVDGFFWLVGQGGTGIQTAPGASRLAADLVLDGRLSPELEEAGVDLAALGPERIRKEEPDG